MSLLPGTPCNPRAWRSARAKGPGMPPAWPPCLQIGRGAGPGSGLPPTPAMDLLPPKTKYNPLRNESLSSLEDGASGSTPPEEPASPSASSLGPMLPPLPADDSPTTLCSFFPKMSTLKLANSGGGRPSPRGDPARASEAAEGLAGDSAPPPLPQDMNKLSGGGGRRTRVEGGQLGGEEWTRHGSFVNKPTRGWLHPNDKVMGPGVSYLVRVSELPRHSLSCPWFWGPVSGVFPAPSVRLCPCSASPLLLPSPDSHFLFFTGRPPKSVVAGSPHLSLFLISLCHQCVVSHPLPVGTGSRQGLVLTPHPRDPKERGGALCAGIGELADWLSPAWSPQYMGCVEVLQSMRALDFNTRTQVTRSARVTLGCCLL